ncbi:MAG: hypothetical protein ABUL46_05950 [Chitinophaga rupis]
MRKIIHPTIILSLLCVYLFMLISCTCRARVRPRAIEPGRPRAIDTGRPHGIEPGAGGAAEILPRLDSSAKRIEKKDAYLGYSYPLSIPRGETRNINAYVTIRNSSSFIKDTLKEIIIDEQGSYSDNKDSVVVYPRNILYYRSLQVSLIDPSNDFTITRIHNSDSQVVDVVNGNRWRWVINTKTNKLEATLILKVVGMGPNGLPDRFDDKTIPIKITIDPTISRNFFDYLTDNPAVSVPMVVGFLAFIGWSIKYWLERKKK